MYDCYYFRHKYFFFFCEKYCEHFQLTKFSELFDGDLMQLQNFFNHFKQYRYMAFTYPNNNILCDGVNFEEEMLTFNYGEVFKDLVFFRPTEQQVYFDKYRSSIVYYGGMNPWGSVKENKFEMLVYGVPLWPTLYWIMLYSLFF